MTLLWLAGCGTAPATRSLAQRQALPAIAGSYHRVQRGETLWRIAYSYGLDVETLAKANRLPSVSQLAVGQRLFIPLPPETSRFLWPVRGSLGPVPATQGVEIAAAPGSVVRASRSGRVAVATHQLSGWGKTVVVDHLDGYLSVYAGLDQLLVSPGTHLRQGIPLGSVGHRALYFEIRYGQIPKNPLALLPPD